MHGQDPGVPPPPHQVYERLSPMPPRGQPYQALPPKAAGPVDQPMGNGAPPNSYYDQYNAIPQAGPPAIRPPRLVSFDYLDRIRDELISLSTKVDSLTRERTELLQYYELYQKTHHDLARYVDINGRYQAIINQLLPMLTPQVQDGVRQDMESIKQLTVTPAQSVPPPPPPATGSVPPVDMRAPPVAVPPGRGRPAKTSAPGSAQPKDNYENTEYGYPRNQSPVTQGSTPAAVPYPSQSAPPPPPAGAPTEYTGYATALPPPSSRALIPQGAKLLTSMPHREVVCAFAMTNPFRYVFTGGKGVVKIWDVNNVRETKQAPLVGTMDCLVNGKQLIVAGEVNYMVICDLASPNPRVVGRIDTPGVMTYALATSNDSKYCFTCCSDGAVKMWDIHNKRMVRDIGSHESTVTCCTLTPDGQRLITGSLDKTVKIWDITGGKEVTQIDCPTSVYSLGFSPIQPPRITVGLEKSIEIRSVTQPAEKREILGVHQECVLSVKYAPNGNWFATTGKDKKWVCWKSSDYSTVFEMPESQSILCCEISACGDYLRFACTQRRLFGTAGGFKYPFPIFTFPDPSKPDLYALSFLESPSTRDVLPVGWLKEKIDAANERIPPAIFVENPKFTDMALPQELWNALQPTELEFLAEEEMIHITPLRKIPALELISVCCSCWTRLNFSQGRVGPFIPPRSAKVPIWLALLLKRKGVCTIQMPEWMDIDHLSLRVDEERSQAAFSSLPFHYVSIANMLMTDAADDIPHLTEIAEHLKTLRDLRQNKALQGLKLINADLFEQGSHLVMDGLSLAEINEIRPVFVEAFNTMRKMLPQSANGEEGQKEP
ncbi:Transducin-like enhancer protein 4 [Phlyctochytrium bullatum]|nr:Transducin-like enhancer protein 4 [Phlyctochytrium bullatum]